MQHGDFPLPGLSKDVQRASSLVVWLLQVVSSSLAKNANNIKYCKFIIKVAVFEASFQQELMIYIDLLYRNVLFCHP